MSSFDKTNIHHTSKPLGFGYLITSEVSPKHYPVCGWSLVYSSSDTAMLCNIMKGGAIWKTTNLQLIIQNTSELPSQPTSALIPYAIVNYC